jgi:hypothetical protein
VGASRCLFGLAPAGVYPATTVTSRAVSSYLTFSPLPVPRFPLAIGGVFSVALSVIGPTKKVGDAQALPGSVPNGARTFLERQSNATTRDHPVGDSRKDISSADENMTLGI